MIGTAEILMNRLKSLKAVLSIDSHMRDCLADAITSLRQQVTDLRDNSQRLMEAADGWKVAAQELADRLRKELTAIANELDHIGTALRSTNSLRGTQLITLAGRIAALRASAGRQG